MNELNYGGPIVLVIMDGVGLAPDGPGNAVSKAQTQFLSKAYKNYLSTKLEACGEAVGILPGQMGTSEVGHNAIGAGQIFKQGIAQVEDAFRTGDIFSGENWHKLIENVLVNNSTLHFGGIMSDGNVHSSISHLEYMIDQAYKEGVKKIRIHAIIDGRDVAMQAEPKYINRIETFMAKYPDVDYCIASGGGRMTTTSDRYEAEWGMVKRGWDAMVHGVAEYTFTSANEAVSTFRAKDPDVQDQYLPTFVITKNGEPVGKVQNNDSFIFYDFRADRAIEIAMAFTYNDFPYFDRGERPNVLFAGMTEYNSDTHVPALTLVQPVHIENVLNRYLSNCGVTQYAISEDVKYGHITFYFNGNSYEAAPGEVHARITSDDVPFIERPWMQASAITDNLLQNLDKYKFVRVNYPNGDMVGHFADLESTIVAMESLDINLKRLAKKVDELGGVMIITADHGNAEELIDENGKPKTSHSMNKVPFIIYDNTENRNLYELNNIEDPGLSNIAATIAILCGHKDYPKEWRAPLIRLK